MLKNEFTIMVIVLTVVIALICAAAESAHPRRVLHKSDRLMISCVAYADGACDQVKIVADRAKICTAVESMAMLINLLDKEVEFIRGLPSVKSGDIDLQNGAYCAQVAQAIQDGQTKFAPDPLWMILDRINSACAIASNAAAVLYDLGEGGFDELKS